MAGPLSGLGQYVPSSLQQTGSVNNAQQQVRSNNEQPTPAGNDVRAQGKPTNQTLESSNRNASQRESFQMAESRVSDSDGEQRRGSLVDIQV